MGPVHTGLPGATGFWKAVASASWVGCRSVGSAVGGEARCDGENVAVERKSHVILGKFNLRAR